MTLSTVFRIQALVFAFFGVFMLIAPGAMMETFAGPGQTAPMFAGVLQNMSIMVLAMATVILNYLKKIEQKSLMILIIHMMKF